MRLKTALIGLSFGSLIAVDASAQDAWQFRRAADPMTDEVRGIASVKSGEYTLVLKCDFGTPGVYADLYSARARQAGRSLRGDAPMTPRGTTSIMERVDSGRPDTRDWLGEWGEYLLGDQGTADLAKKIMTGGRLAVRIERGASGHTDVTFSLAGSASAIRSVYRACRVPVPT